MLTVVAAVNAQTVDLKAWAASSHENRLKNCPKNEIRCIWITDSLLYVTELSVDLAERKSVSIYKAFNWAIQGYHERVFEAGEIKEMQTVLAELPDSDKTVKQLQTFSIAYWDGKKVSVKHYAIDDLPSPCKNFLKLATHGGVEKKPFNYLKSVSLHQIDAEGGTQKPAASSKSKSEDKEKSEPESKGRSQ